MIGFSWLGMIAKLIASKVGSSPNKGIAGQPEGGQEGFRMPQAAKDFTQSKPGAQTAMALLGGARNVGSAMRGDQTFGDVAAKGGNYLMNRGLGAAGFDNATGDMAQKKIGGFIGGLFGR